jgi:glycosyltransferase involved in cell wall biosynthesis
MAGLGLGRPLVTTQGYLTEPIWEESGAVALTATTAPESFVARAEALLAEPEARTRIAHQAALLYEQRFSVASLLRTLREADRNAESA